MDLQRSLLLSIDLRNPDAATIDHRIDNVDLCPFTETMTAP
jgi:hypothetical protein